VWVKVLDVRPDERRLTLSLRQAIEEGYGEVEKDEERMTLGDVFGEQFEPEDEEEEEGEQE